LNPVVEDQEGEWEEEDQEEEDQEGDQEEEEEEDQEEDERVGRHMEAEGLKNRRPRDRHVDAMLTVSR
jgi:hypothetical protein